MPPKAVTHNPSSTDHQAEVEAAAKRARRVQQASTSRRNLNGASLPRCLIRPPPPATIDNMYFMDLITPETGAQALQSLARMFIAGPSSIFSLPFSLPVDSDEDIPATHALAIVSPANDGRINVSPVHETILRVHCTALPRFPVVDDIPENHIPVISLSLPHPDSFVPMLEYLYTHRQHVLFLALCPGLQVFGCTPFLPGTPQLRLDKDVVDRAARFLLATRPVIESMRYIHGLWHNMVTLGIHDDGLWEVVLLAYSLYAAAALC